MALDTDLDPRERLHQSGAMASNYALAGEAMKFGLRHRAAVERAMLGPVVQQASDKLEAMMVAGETITKKQQEAYLFLLSRWRDLRQSEVLLYGLNE
jgi:hypothetical protein